MEYFADKSNGLNILRGLSPFAPYVFNILRAGGRGEGGAPLCQQKAKGHREMSPFPVSDCVAVLRHFDELDLAVLAAVQDLDPALGIAEDEHVAVAELTFLHRLFDGHGTHGNR